jgi:hypothetical protein
MNTNWNYLVVYKNPLVIWKFSETCCKEKGVPEECMGLCREKINNGTANMERPVNQCVVHNQTIHECMYQERKGK